MWLPFLLVWPLIELTLLIWLGQRTSVMTVMLFIVGSGLIGSTLLRWQGWRVWHSMQAQARSGENPQRNLLDGALIFAGAVLLIIPGVLSDIVGLSLMIPLVRSLLRNRLALWAKRRVQFEVQSGGTYTAQWSVNSGPGNSAEGSTISGEIIEAEFERLPADPLRIEGQAEELKQNNRPENL